MAFGAKPQDFQPKDSLHFMFKCISAFLYTYRDFLGPRGPLVLPSVGPSVPSVPSARKIWITYIQAYMPYES